MQTSRWNHDNSISGYLKGEIAFEGKCKDGHPVVGKEGDTNSGVKGRKQTHVGTGGIITHGFLGVCGWHTASGPLGVGSGQSLTLRGDMRSGHCWTLSLACTALSFASSKTLNHDKPK